MALTLIPALGACPICPAMPCWRVPIAFQCRCKELTGEKPQVMAACQPQQNNHKDMDLAKQMTLSSSAPVRQLGLAFSPFQLLLALLVDQNLAQPHDLRAGGSDPGVRVPALLDEPPQILWGLRIDLGPLLLDGHLHNDLHPQDNYVMLQKPDRR